MQQLDIDFDFDVSYIGDAAFAAAQDSAALAATSTANVDDYISACKCNGSVCDTNTLGVDEILQVCIKSSLGDTVAITKLKTLDLTQTGGGTFSVMQAGDTGLVDNAALSAIVNDASNTVVDTIVPARFFDTTNNIAVSGIVEVDFDGAARRLVAFGSNRLGSNDRKMIAAPFEDAELPQETDAKFNFDVPVEKASNEEDQFIDMNSGSTISAAAGALAAVAVSYLW